MRKTLAAVALVVAVAFTVLPATDAGAWGRRERSTQTATMTQSEISFLEHVLDRVALTDIELSPFGRWLVNGALKALMPKLCPVVAGLAAPAYQQLVLTGCQGVATAPDPYAELLEFLPLACDLGDVIFPDYKEVLRLACGLLF